MKVGCARPLRTGVISNARTQPSEELSVFRVVSTHTSRFQRRRVPTFAFRARPIPTLAGRPSVLACLNASAKQASLGNRVHWEKQLLVCQWLRHEMLQAGIYHITQP